MHLRHFVPHFRLDLAVSSATCHGESLPQTTSILLVGAGPGLSRLRAALSKHFLTVESARDLDASRELTLRCRFHLLVLVDPQAPWHELRQSLEASDGLPASTLLVADKSRAEAAVEALRDGVSDVLLRPFSTDEIVTTINAICRDGASADRRRPGRGALALVGDTGPMRDIGVLIGRIAPTDATVLVEGETGTGRNLVARLLHEQSGRQGPFIPVDCGAITGGIPDTANPSAATLHLKNVDALPIDLQGQLLGNMEEYVRAGNRIVASTQVSRRTSSPGAASAAISFAGLTRYASRCRRCANGGRIFRCLRRSSSTACLPGWRCRRFASKRTNSKRFATTPGRVTCGNCATWWNRLYCAAVCRQTRLQGRSGAAP